jgi:hypothetical protein
MLQIFAASQVPAGDGLELADVSLMLTCLVAIFELI